jgi:hypothetical protein
MVRIFMNDEFKGFGRMSWPKEPFRHFPGGTKKKT